MNEQFHNPIEKSIPLTHKYTTLNTLIHDP
jgi:hypothetical protein